MQGVKYCTDRTHTVLFGLNIYISILCTIQGHLHNLCEYITQYFLYCEYITQYFLYFLYEYLMQVSDTMAECHCICQSCLPPPPTPDYPNIHTNNYGDYYPNTYTRSHTTKHTHTHNENQNCPPQECPLEGKSETGNSEYLIHQNCPP